MATTLTQTIEFPLDLMVQVDEYGALLMSESFRSDTRRGRSAVIRRLVQEGLRSQTRQINRARENDNA